MSSSSEVYLRPASMEPMYPTKELEVLSGMCARILVGAGRLTGQVHSPVVLGEVAELIRGMNCYYSNLIEGHRTTPLDIKKALEKDFSDDPARKDNQLLGLAHVETERELQEALVKNPGLDVYASDFICWIHRRFYERLPESLHFSEDRDGKRYRVIPGEIRDYMVGVGRHTPPHHDSIAAFMKRFGEFYAGSPARSAERLIAIAAAHHRLAWIHPFGDGNGRVVRLHSQALLIRHGLDSHGLWSLSRGLARSKAEYYRRLAEADLQRQGDLDGRGNLSDSGLASFCRFFLETALDQVEFMSDLLDLQKLRQRVEVYFAINASRFGKNGESLMRVVRTLVDEGEIDRSRVRDVSGKKATVSADLIKLGLAEGFFTSPSARGPLRISFPEKTLDVYFPKLYSEGL